VLREELFYPEDRALHFVEMFDRNGDGKLSTAEFTQFRKKIEETYVYMYRLYTLHALTHSCTG